MANLLRNISFCMYNQQTIIELYNIFDIKLKTEQKHGILNELLST